MIINGQRYEAEPAVEAYVKDLQAENEKLKNELWSEKAKAIHGEARAKDYDKEAQELANVLQVKVQELGKAMIKINALKAENAQLEEKYQKATGVIATDSLPTAVDCYKLKKMCIENQGCRECAFRRENVDGFDRCAFEGLPMDWTFHSDGGAEDERNN